MEEGETVFSPTTRRRTREREKVSSRWNDARRRTEGRPERLRKRRRKTKLTLEPSTQNLQLRPRLRNLYRLLHLLLILSPNPTSSLQHLVPLLLRNPTPRVDSSQTLERLKLLLGSFGIGEGEVRELKKFGEGRESSLDEESVKFHDGEGGGEPVVGEGDVEDGG